MTILKNNFSPIRSVIAERFKFNRWYQGNNETIAEYVAALKNMALSCQYGEFLNDALREKFVEGISDVELQRKSLKKNELTFANFVEAALSFEMTTRTSHKLRNQAAPKVEDANRIEGTKGLQDRYGGRKDS